MVGPLGGFDVVEERLIDDCLAGRGDRSEALRGALGIGPGNGCPPLAVPMLADRDHRLLRDGMQECRLVEQRMADATVAPVEQYEQGDVASKVAGVEVAMDECLRQAARG